MYADEYAEEDKSIEQEILNILEEKTEPEYLILVVSQRCNVLSISVREAIWRLIARGEIKFEYNLLLTKVGRD